MTAAEEGILMLCCRLGDPAAKPLSIAQFRDLGEKVRTFPPIGDPLSDLRPADLTRLGIPEPDADQILALLDRLPRLWEYLSRGQKLGIEPITLRSPAYPRRIAQKHGVSCPPVFFALGDLTLLDRPSVAVVGSRQLGPENEAFAKAAGRQSAAEGLVLVSGNAIGADQTAQNACLDAGGSCVVFVADRLMDHSPRDRVLYLSEHGYDLPFTAPRALHRNGLIHAQGDRTIAVQCTFGKGGTWEGCLENLSHGWSDLFVFDDGTPGTRALMEQGATGISHLTSINGLQKAQLSLF